MAEAVDRLRLVADREQVVALQRLEHVELQPVRVLELVDHDQREALGPAGALGGIREQVADAQLEIVEVDRRPRRLGRRVGRAEGVEQRVEQGERGLRVVRRAGLAVRGPGLAVGGTGGRLERLRAAAELRRVERTGQRRLAAGGRDPLGGLQRVARLADADAGPGGREPGGGRRRGRGERRGVGRRLGRRHGQPRMGRPAAAERGVGAGHHRLQLAAVRRGEVDRRVALRRGPGLERRFERLGGEPPLGGLVEHAEARVEPGGQRAAAQDPGAEAVDRPDPGGVDRARVLHLPQLDEAAPDPLAQLGGRLLGEGQRQDRADGDAVLQHRLGEPLDHHRGLAGAGPGREQRRPLAVGDRGALLGRAPHAGGSLRGSPARQIAG